MHFFPQIYKGIISSHAIILQFLLLVRRRGLSYSSAITAACGWSYIHADLYLLIYSALGCWAAATSQSQSLGSVSLQLPYGLRGLNRTSVPSPHCQIQVIYWQLIYVWATSDLFLTVFVRKLKSSSHFLYWTIWSWVFQMSFVFHLSLPDHYFNPLGSSWHIWLKLGVSEVRNSSKLWESWWWESLGQSSSRADVGKARCN